MADVTLDTVGITLLLVTMIFRMMMVGLSLRKFSKMFDNKKEFRDGINLFKYLEIPGLENFVKQEIFFTILPYTALAIVIFTSPASQVGINDLGIIWLIFSILVLVIWVAMDFVRSYLINRKLEAVRKETSVLRSISGNILDGLKYVVYIRGSIPKTAVSLGRRALVGVAKDKVKQSTKDPNKKPLGIAALIALEKMISFPERVIGKITDWGKDVIDDKLKKMFEKYSERSKFRLFVLTLWCLVPSILLYLLAISNN